jgi:hypothetical protein
MEKGTDLVLAGQAEVTQLGWRPPEGGLELDEWLAYGRQLALLEQVTQWVIGDWWAYGAERGYGDGKELAAAAGIDYGTVRVYASVARSYEMLTRVNNLSFKHHRLVAGRDDRHEWLGRAEVEGWSSGRLQSEVKATDQAARDLERSAQAGGRATVERADAVEWLGALADASVDLLLTDPPYSTDVDDIDDFAWWLVKAQRVVRPTGRMVVFHGRYPDEVGAYLNMAARLGWDRELAVWHYADTLGPSPTGRLKTTHQMVLVVHGPEAPDLHTTSLVDRQSCFVAPMNQEAGGRWFPWQKPQLLAERLVATFAPPGGTVVDPFAGAGTFLVAAAALGRQAAGCDDDPGRIDECRRRGVEVVDR